MSIICDKLRNRCIKQNKNALILMSGETGSGKSITGLTVGHEIDPTLCVDNLDVRIAKSVTEFLEFTNNMSKGQVLIWDEAGVGLSASEWWKRANILINYVLQTFRHENICVIFTAPTMKDLDSKARTRFHYYMEPVSIDYEKKLAKVKVRRWQHNPELGKTYSKRLIHKDGRFELVVSHMEVPLAPQEIIDKYESIMKPWKRNVKETARIELETLQQDSKKAATEMELVRDVLTNNKVEKLSSFRKSGKQFIDKNLIAMEYNVGDTKARRVARYLEKNVLQNPTEKATRKASRSKKTRKTSK